MVDFIPKPIDDVDLISVLILTRGRPEKLVRAIKSLESLAANKDKIDLWIYVDDDDTLTHELIDSGWDKDIGFPIHWHISTRPVTHGDAFSEIWQKSSNAGIYFGFPDDHELTTCGWDDVIRETFRDLPDDRIAVGYLPDPFVPEGGITVMAVTAQWVNQVGHFIVPHFPYWYGDKWLEQIAEMVDRKFRIPVGLYPMDGKKGKTLRLWDLPFWERFFHLLLTERADTARRIIEKLTDDNSLMRTQAIDLMHENIEKFEKEAEDEQSRDQLLAIQLAFTAEGEDKSDSYLKALRQAEEHLEAMRPRIIKMKTQRVLRYKVKVLAQSIVGHIQSVKEATNR